MLIETVIQISITTDGKLFLSLESEGKPEYQYVYREAAGVYWDQKNKGFKSTPIRKWTCSEWYSHIAQVVKASLGVELRLATNADWKSVSEKDKQEIVQEYAI